MNQWLFLQRIKGPSFLLMFGITALLDEFTSVGYARSWPLYLILWGVLSLAERAALAQADPDGYSTANGAPAGDAGSYRSSSTSIVPSPEPPPPSTPSGSDSGEGRQ